ncbi:MAG: hypothetical protein WD749_15315 [Phycisphaerales bacterium]
MPQLEEAAADRLADHFVNYLFDDYQGSRHVRRIASWMGFVLCGIRRVPGVIWKVGRKRQLVFQVGARRFKAKYDHQVGTRGGIRIVEVLPLQGQPEGVTVTTITSLREAERFYRGARRLLAS